MKKLFIAFCILPLTVFADIQSIHNVNFYPLENYCGWHAEVDGNFLYLTSILPQGQLICTSEDTCSGKSVIFECNSEDMCTRMKNFSTVWEDVKGRGETVKLAADGNLIYINNKSKVFKNFRSQSSAFRWCE